MAETVARKFYRSKSNRMLAGVCGGIAQYFNVDAMLVRIAYAVLTIFSFGVGIVLYLLLWLFTPEQ